MLEAAGVDGRQVDGGSGGGGDQDGCAGGVSSLAGVVRPDVELVCPGAGVCVTGADTTVSEAGAALPGADAEAEVDGADTELDGAEVEPGRAPAWEAAAVPDVAVPAKVAGERQTGFVSAVDGVAGLAAADGVLAFDRVSGSDVAELAKPELAARAVADPPLADTVLPDVTTGSGAEAPSGLAGASGWPLPLDKDSSGGGIAALGMVASERLPPSGMVTADESPSSLAEPAADGEPEPEEEAGPDGESDCEGESDGEPAPFLA